MYDGTYFVDLTYISNLPEAIPSSFQQQTTRIVGDNFYAMLSYSPSKGSNDDTIQATYINMYRCRPSCSKPQTRFISIIMRPQVSRRRLHTHQAVPLGMRQRVPRAQGRHFLPGVRVPGRCLPPRSRARCIHCICRHVRWQLPQRLLLLPLRL